MLAATRSAAKQPKLEEVKGTETKDKKANESRKRKALEPKATESKKRKSAASDGVDEKPLAEPRKGTSDDLRTLKPTDPSATEPNVITINRAPVLELWASCVTHFLYPSASWSTCLSVGGAIATVTAIAKGRSIGAIEKPDPGDAAERRQNRKEKAEREQLDDIEVMHFHFPLKEGQTVVSGKPKKGNEAALRKKFGEAAFERCKGVMQEALNKWEGKEAELDGQAFKMYEDFRSSVPAGQRGWGRKGQLNLQNVRDVVGAG